MWSADASSNEMLSNYNQQVRTHYQSHTVAVKVPLAQSFFTGLVVAIPVFIGVGSVAYWIGLPFTSILVGSFLLSITSWATVMAVTWFRLQDNWRNLVWNLEERMNLDLNGDGDKGSPNEIVITAPVNNGRTLQRGHFKVSDRKMQELANHITSGKSFSKREVCSEAKIMSQGEFEGVRDKMLELEWIDWVDEEFPQQGLYVTERGEGIFQKLAEGKFRPLYDASVSGGLTPLPSPNRGLPQNVYASTTHAPLTHEVRHGN